MFSPVKDMVPRCSRLKTYGEATILMAMMGEGLVGCGEDMVGWGVGLVGCDEGLVGWGEDMVGCDEGFGGM